MTSLLFGTVAGLLNWLVMLLSFEETASTLEEDASSLEESASTLDERASARLACSFSCAVITTTCVNDAAAIIIARIVTAVNIFSRCVISFPHVVLPLNILNEVLRLGI